MYYYDLLLKITALADDPAGDDLFDRAKDHFATALKTALDNGEFTDLDIFGYKKLKTDLVLSTSPYDMSTLKVLKISEIYLPPGDNDDDVRVTMKSSQQIANINNSELSPSDYDLYIHQNGEYLRGYVSATSNFDLATDIVYMDYYEDPQISGWDATTGTGTVVTDLFSETFLERLAIVAGGTLLAEDNL